METKTGRKKTRKLLYQELFAGTFGSVDKELFYSSFFEDVFKFEKDEEYLNKMREIVKNKEGFFIKIIEKYSPKFEFEKMNIINILPIYISLAEIFFLNEDIPIKASINEAIELAKFYSDEPSKKIVNGVLNQVVNDFEELEKEKEKEKEKKYKKFKSIFK